MGGFDEGKTNVMLNVIQDVMLRSAQHDVLY